MDKMFFSPNSIDSKAKMWYIKDINKLKKQTIMKTFIKFFRVAWNRPGIFRMQALAAILVVLTLILMITISIIEPELAPFMLILAITMALSMLLLELI
jgi:hypothetical protein